MDAPLITLSQAKSWLNITDTTSDQLVTDLARAATGAILRHLARDPRRQPYTETVSGLGGPVLPLGHYPIQSVTAVSLVSMGLTSPAQSLDLSTITWDDNAIIWRGGRFPRDRRNVSVSYVAGIAPLPDEILQATRYTLQAMFSAQSVDQNATGESYVGLGTAQWWATGAGAIPPSALSLLEPHVNRFKRA